MNFEQKYNLNLSFFFFLCAPNRKNLFENKDAGASSDAMKVLVLITDGDPSDTDEDANMIINTYTEKRIIRFVIGVREIPFIIENIYSLTEQPHPKSELKLKFGR